MENKLKIGLDLDGVLYDFVEALKSWCHLSTGRALETLPYANCWGFYKEQWGMTTSEFLEMYAEGINAGHIFTVGDAPIEAVESLHRIVEAGHELHVITARKIKGAEELGALATKNWLDRNNIPYNSLNIVATTKNEVATELGVSVAIDDAPHHHEELEEAGITCYLQNRPWNVTYEAINRVDDVSAFAKLLLAK